MVYITLVQRGVYIDDVFSQFKQSFVMFWKSSFCSVVFALSQVSALAVGGSGSGSPRVSSNISLSASNNLQGVYTRQLTTFMQTAIIHIKLFNYIRVFF